MIDDDLEGNTFSHTENIKVTTGVFHLGDYYRVPFYCAVMTFQQVGEYLELVTDDETYVRQDWNVEDLFQREVDYERVQDIAKNYLAPTNPRPQFFNSLTVVLRSKPNLTSFTAPKTEVPNATYHRIESGPYELIFKGGEEIGNNRVPAKKNEGYLRWNREQVHAVAIDGQHRLAAIKELAGNPRSQQSAVSVIFLVIDPKFGFSASTQNGSHEYDATSAMRSLFIDLNKHAVPVSRARNLLLDDRDPHAQFVRSLFSRSLSYSECEGPNPNYEHLDFFGEHGEFVDCIPLSIVDWHGEQKSKIDVGPYVCSVLGLEWIVKEILKKSETELPDFKDLDDEKYYSNLLKGLQGWNLDVTERVSFCEGREIAFYLENEDIIRLKEQFSRQWGQPVTRILTTLSSYSEVIRLRRDAGTISPTFAQWYQIKSLVEAGNRNDSVQKVNRQRLQDVEDFLDREYPEADLRTKFRDVVQKIDNSKKDNFFFFLVGQRALFKAFLELKRSGSGREWAESADIPYEEFHSCPNDFYAHFMIKAMNQALRPYEGQHGLFHKLVQVTPTELDNSNYSFIPTEFWAGAFLKRDVSEIDFSNSACERGKTWILLVTYMYWFLIANELTHHSREQVLEIITNLDAHSDLCFVDDLKRGIVNTMGNINPHANNTRAYKHPISFLMLMLDADQYNVEIHTHALEDRLACILEHLLEKP